MAPPSDFEAAFGTTWNAHADAADAEEGQRVYFLSTLGRGSTFNRDGSCQVSTAI